MRLPRRHRSDALGGSVVLIGTPAEEGGAGKVELIKRGGFGEEHICLIGFMLLMLFTRVTRSGGVFLLSDGVDLAMMVHPGPGSTLYASGNAMESVILTCKKPRKISDALRCFVTPASVFERCCACLCVRVDFAGLFRQGPELTCGRGTVGRHQRPQRRHPGYRSSLLTPAHPSVHLELVASVPGGGAPPSAAPT